MIERGARHVVAKHVNQRHGMRGRLDIRYVEFAQLLNIGEHLIELSLKQLRFPVREVNPRQMRDIGNVHMS